jgi:membrane protein implicated in regulation of membrane protease activity
VLGGALATQILLFTATSVAGILLFRRALVARFGPGRSIYALEVDSLIGASAVALEDLPPGGVGKVELRGTAWTARNSGGVAVAEGHRCTVERVEGLTLWVRIAAEEYLGTVGAATSS